MKVTITIAIVIVQALAVQALRIVQGATDGWADIYARALGDGMRAAGHDVVLSAPAGDYNWLDNKPNKARPPVPRTEPCHYDSCPPMSGPMGHNVSRPELNWVNSDSNTAIKLGVNTFGPARWNGSKPDLVVVGVNHGQNIWLMLPFSATIGAAAFAVRELQIPAIAFSGAMNTWYRFPWHVDPMPNASNVFAELATDLINTIAIDGPPYLPDGVFLNVNFPEVNENCTDADSFFWVLSRVYRFKVTKDISWCGRRGLPTELRVFRKNREGECYIAVTPVDVHKRTVKDLAKQKFVLEKIQDLLVCMPPLATMEDMEDDKCKQYPHLNDCINPSPEDRS